MSVYVIIHVDAMQDVGFDIFATNPCMYKFVIPSRVSGRGYKIGPVCLCVCACVCLSVSALTLEPFKPRA